MTKTRSKTYKPVKTSSWVWVENIGQNIYIMVCVDNRIHVARKLAGDTFGEHVLFVSKN